MEDNAETDSTSKQISTMEEYLDTKTPVSKKKTKEMRNDAIEELITEGLFGKLGNIGRHTSR